MSQRKFWFVFAVQFVGRFYLPRVVVRKAHGLPDDLENIFRPCLVEVAVWSEEKENGVL